MSLVKGIDRRGCSTYLVTLAGESHITTLKIPRHPSFFLLLRLLHDVIIAHTYSPVNLYENYSEFFFSLLK